jgi:protein-disulfide isomerase-like protein with CxxC motif
LIALIIGIEKKFNFMDEVKVPKDLLNDTSHEHSDSEPLFATITAAKAKKMRHHVFTILKRIQQIKMLERK